MTTMDSDSESQDSDEGRRFRFEATRKDAMGLQSRKRDTSPHKTTSRQRSRENARHNARKEDRQVSDRRKEGSSYEERKISKIQKNISNDSRRKEYRYKDRAVKNSCKELKEFQRKDSKSRDERDSKSRDDKCKRSHDRNRERARDKYRRHSRDRDRSSRKQKSLEREKQESQDKRIKNHESGKLCNKSNEKTNDSQDCKDLNLSDFDIVSDTEANSDYSNGINELKNQIANRKPRNLKEKHKVKSRNGDKSSGLSLNNPREISDFLLASTSAKSTNNSSSDVIFREKYNVEFANLNSVEKKESENECGSVGDEYYGPILPPCINKSVEVPRIVGPNLPDYMRNCIDRSEDVGASDAFGPVLPPPHSQRMSEQEIVEPVLPDDGLGPLPADHPALRGDVVQQQLEYRAQLLKRELAEMDDVEEKKREEWMTELPKVQAASLGLGPRKFRARAGPDLSDQSAWTDTPADRAKKQREGVMRKPIDSTDPEQSIPKKLRKIEEKSLLELHQRKLQKKKQKKAKEAKNSHKSARRPFDRAIDLQVNHFDETRKKAIFAKAAALDDRFSRGKL